MKMPSFLRKGGFKPGSVEDFPAGSVDRAKAMTVRLVSSWSLASTTKKDWELSLELAKKERAAELLGFKDFNAYLTASIGETEAASTTRFEAKEAKMGRPRKVDAASTFSQTGRAKSNGVGIVTQRYLDALAAKRPDLLDKIQAGELKPKTAARQAGIIRVLSELEIVQKAFKKLTARQRRQFDAWRKTQ